MKSIGTPKINCNKRPAGVAGGYLPNKDKAAARIAALWAGLRAPVAATICASISDACVSDIMLWMVTPKAAAIFTSVLAFGIFVSPRSIDHKDGEEILAFLASSD